jgi:prepilin-type N-terminal cleavage/methylation domain-containing protein
MSLSLLKNPIVSRGLHCGNGRRRAGLTLIEVMIASAMIALTCTTFMYVFTQLNTMAMIARLYTGAAAIAQNQVDLIGTDAPFVPSNSEIPTELTPGTASTSVNVYQDPISGNTIPGTMTTVVSAVNASYANGSVTDTLYLYTATVTVTYTYRNRSYSVALSTMRTADI